MFHKLNIKKNEFLKVLLISFLFFGVSLYSKDKVILALGDSLTEGLGVETNAAWPSLMDKEIKKMKTGYTVINGGLSGSTSASGPSRLKWYLRIKPEIIVIALGANDGLRGLPISELTENLSLTIELAQKSGAKVVLAGMKVPPNYGPDYSKKFEQTYLNLARKYQLTLIPFLLEKVAGEEKLNQADRIHPNEKGHQIVMRNVLTVLEPLIK